MRSLASLSANRGAGLATATTRASRVVVRAAPVAEGDRLRLSNLAPAPGSRRPNKRKGRGHAAGQGGSCGFGMRGQKSRSGSGVRPGFEGGQTPLYRRVPKLKGIAGGMPAGLPSYVTINVGQLEAECEAGAIVDAGSLERLVGSTGARGKLPLKILGSGDLNKPLTVKAAAFSESAAAKIAAAGGTVEIVALKPKWTRAAAAEKAAATKAGELVEK